MNLEEWGWGRVALVTAAYWAVMAAVVGWSLGTPLYRIGDLLGFANERSASLESIEVTQVVPLLAVILGPPIVLAIAVAVARHRARRG